LSAKVQDVPAAQQYAGSIVDVVIKFELEPPVLSIDISLRCAPAM
jgi:hypothetical protein